MKQQTDTQVLYSLSRKMLYAVAILNKKNHQCTSTDLYHWFQRKIKREQLHGALELLLNHIPPLILQSKVINGRGRPMFLYSLSDASVTLIQDGGV